MASLDRARDFLSLNARLLERRLYAFHFEGGEARAVVAALAAYQNPDGGFGSGLEPDKRTATSQPVDLQTAFEILDEVGVLSGPMALRACDWLETVTTDAGGVPFSLPSAQDAPHAPWWAVEGSDPPADANPTAAILGLLLKNGVDHQWVTRASAFCWAEAEGAETELFHTLMPLIAFLQAAPDRPRAERVLTRLAERIRGLVEMDPDATGYVKKPLDWAPRPDSFCRPLFTDADIALHLRALALRQLPDGGWPINWQAISPGVELEWRGVMTLRTLVTLRAYGRALQG